MFARKSIGFAVILLLAVGCGQKPAHQPAVKNPGGADPDVQKNATLAIPKKLTAEHLPNPWQIHPKVISGGLPAGDAAFKQLADLGVKTVISVDGAKPDVALAKKHGLRYVHLPHGYNGIPPERVRELAKAVRDLPGPIYIHCHHGKHRSPAAAAVACVGAGLLDSAAAEPFLKSAGTSESYQGLYASARDARTFETRLLDELVTDLPETAKIPPLAEAMVALEHTHDHMLQISQAQWKSPPLHPDLDPAHKALLLREHFTELLRTDAVRDQPEKFQARLRESEAQAQQVEDALRTWKAAGGAGPPPAAAEKSFAALTANCKSCHVAYRDVPLSTK